MHIWIGCAHMDRVCTYGSGVTLIISPTRMDRVGPSRKLVWKACVRAMPCTPSAALAVHPCCHPGIPAARAGDRVEPSTLEGHSGHVCRYAVTRRQTWPGVGTAHMSGHRAVQGLRAPRQHAFGTARSAHEHGAQGSAAHGALGEG